MDKAALHDTGTSSGASPETLGTQPPIYDVIQIGYGPVSQVLALMLARQGRRIAIFERWTSRYSLPRAVCIDHEMFRMLGTLGLRDKLPKISHPAPPYRWFNADWRELLHIDWSKEAISGGTEVNFVHQPTLEEMLDGEVSAQPGVALNLGWEAIAVDQAVDYAEVTIRQTATGTERTVRGRYLIGLDGANSIVRKSIGARQEDLGFNADWLVIDILPHENAALDIPPAAQWCNPERPTTIVPAGIRDGRYYRRWEFMRLPHETVGELEVDAVAWKLLEPWVKPHQATMVRNKVYSFRSLIAEGWRDRRIMIAGDAAHVMPPFMGQGMCSGLRDDWNLAWKLNLVLNNEADPLLLDSYERERRPHVKDIIELSMYLGKVICIPDAALAAQRDRDFFEGTALPPPPFPHLIDGFLDFQPDGAIRAPAGELSPHGRVRQGSREGWFDDVIGTGFVLISIDPQMPAHLVGRPRGLIACLDLKLALLCEAGTGSPGQTIDLDGKYHAFMRAHDVTSMIVRPDFYLFGAATTTRDLMALIERLAQAVSAHHVYKL
jgi:3-(3-hydroxy-phenyl)propionate hydroxylase/flavoprotein hydroxylase